MMNPKVNGATMIRTYVLFSTDFLIGAGSTVESYQFH